MRKAKLTIQLNARAQVFLLAKVNEAKLRLWETLCLIWAWKAVWTSRASEARSCGVGVGVSGWGWVEFSGYVCSLKVKSDTWLLSPIKRYQPAQCPPFTLSASVDFPGHTVRHGRCTNYSPGQRRPHDFIPLPTLHTHLGGLPERISRNKVYMNENEAETSGSLLMTHSILPCPWVHTLLFSWGMQKLSIFQFLVETGCEFLLYPRFYFLIFLALLSCYNLATCIFSASTLY